MNRATGESAFPGPMRLRAVRADDLDALFGFQCDPQGAAMAMVVPRSREAFDTVWGAIAADPAATAWVMDVAGRPVGSIGCFKRDGLDAIGYIVGREWWGRGYATSALRQALMLYPTRPLHAWAASSNAGSIKVLTRCGFVATGTTHEPPTDRYLACEVTSFVLNARAQPDRADDRW